MASTSRFEVGDSFATIPDSVSEATTLFTWFDKAKTNDLDPTDFWGTGAPYVDFYGFQVLDKCVTHLEAVYNSHRDFM